VTRAVRDWLYRKLERTLHHREKCSKVEVDSGHDHHSGDPGEILFCGTGRLRPGMRWRTSPRNDSIRRVRRTQLRARQRYSGFVTPSPAPPKWPIGGPSFLTLIAASTSTAIASSARTFWDRVMARPVHGPSIPRPARSYGPDFPLVTVGDIIQTQRAVLDHLGNRSPSTRYRRLDWRHAGLAVGHGFSHPRRQLHQHRCGAARADGPGAQSSSTPGHPPRRQVEEWRLRGRPARRWISPGAQDCHVGSYKSAELFSTRFGRNPTATAKIPGPNRMLVSM